MSKIQKKHPDSIFLKQHVERILREWCYKKWAHLSSSWFERLRYPLLDVSPGKRLRPLLIYGLGEIWNIHFSDLDSLAIAIEVMHTYSLVHDDLPAMDNDDFRRGALSAHRMYDEADAILIGDALLSESWAELSSMSTIHPLILIQVMRCFGDYCGPKHLMSGQWSDLKTIPEAYEDLLKVYEGKTSSLLKFCIVAVALIAGKTSPEIWAESVGCDWGIAFQIANDLQEKKPMRDTGRIFLEKDFSKKTTLSFLSEKEAYFSMERFAKRGLETLLKECPDQKAEEVARSLFFEFFGQYMSW